MFSKRWSPQLTVKYFGGTPINVLGPKGSTARCGTTTPAKELLAFIFKLAHIINPDSQPLLLI